MLDVRAQGAAVRRADHRAHAVSRHAAVRRGCWSEGRIIEPGRWDLCTLFDVNYEPRGMSARDLKEGIYWLTERLYSDDCTEFRRRGFFTHMRRARRQAVATA